MILTSEAIRKIAPNAKVDLDVISDTIDKYGDRYGLVSQKRIEAFIAQAAHETAGFRTFTEYATGAAYEGRADLGNNVPGDGVKFKGRGIFMTTGRTNYKATSLHLFNDTRLLDTPALLTDPKNATISAMYFWKSRGLNELADKGDFKTITRRINGGLNGWADRLDYYEKIKLFFGNNPVISTAFTGFGLAAVIVIVMYFILNKNKLK